jgi:hypothetical protein
MNRIDLTGLSPELPIGAMAAFGCLRVCRRLPGLYNSKLSWQPHGGSFHAVLWTPAETTRDDLVDALIADVKTAATRPELIWSEQIKAVPRDIFLTAAREALDRATAQDRESADWFSSFGSELALDDGKIQSTPFDMSVARQKFLADAVKLAASLSLTRGGAAKAAVEAYREALFGPWKYQDDQHSLGWDPSTMKLGAFTHKAPSTMVNTGVRAAVWLAFESLPLFPCFSNFGLETRAFRRERREVALCWPVWTAPLSLPALATLLAWGALVTGQPSPQELRARGITGVFRAARFKPNKYLFSFRTPELVFAPEAHP